MMEVSEQYLEENCTPEPPLLREINRFTHARVLKPRMLSGHVQGRLLSMLSKLVRPKTILEVGTFTGYATLCLAEGLQPDGRIYTIDKNDELEATVRGFFARSTYHNQIEYIIGLAEEELPKLAGEMYDLVFIDADKANNLAYYKQVIGQVAPGGLVLTDNVLWDGKVTEGKTDRRTQLIREFNAFVAADKRVEKVLLPLRDGLYVIRKL